MPALLIPMPALLGCMRGPCVAILAPDGKSQASVAVAAHRNFWMHNTEIPLDMIFADASGWVIGIVANAEPFSDKEVGVEGGSEYVLEVNGGFCAKNGIKVGDRLNFSGFSPQARD